MGNMEQSRAENDGANTRIEHRTNRVDHNDLLSVQKSDQLDTRQRAGFNSAEFPINANGDQDDSG